MHPSSFYIGNNLENVGILISTVLYLQHYKCCLRFTWMRTECLSLTFQASTYILGCWPGLSFLPLSEIQSLTRDTFPSESFTKIGKLLWKVSILRTVFLKNSQQILLPVVKATVLCLHVQLLVLIQKHSHGLEKRGCMSRSSRSLNVRGEERDWELLVL